MMSLIDELRDQLSGSPSNAPSSMEALTGSFRHSETEMARVSHLESLKGAIAFEDRTDPEHELERQAHDVARRWVEARRLRGFLAD